MQWHDIIMLFHKRNRLYAFVLSMSSALLTCSASYIVAAEKPENTSGEKIERSEKTTKSTTDQMIDSKIVGRKFRSDFNLMQNLIMQLEEEQTRKVHPEVGNKKDKNTSNNIASSKESKPFDEDDQWIEDQVGSARAATLRKRERGQQEEKNPIQNIQPRKNTKLRVRSR